MYAVSHSLNHDDDNPYNYFITFQLLEGLRQFRATIQDKLAQSAKDPWL